MPKVKDIVEIIESRAPLEYMLEFDCAGLNVGDMQSVVTGILIAQNVTYSTIEECAQAGANLLITHHPCVFGEEPDEYMQSLVAKAKERGLILYSCHTNLDCCKDGLNDFVANKLGMTSVSVIDVCARCGDILSLPLLVLFSLLLYVVASCHGDTLDESLHRGFAKAVFSGVGSLGVVVAHPRVEVSLKLID